MTFGQIAEIVDKGSSCMYSIWMNGGELITVLCVVLPPPSTPPQKKDWGVAKAEINCQLINIIVTVVDEFI